MATPRTGSGSATCSNDPVAQAESTGQHGIGLRRHVDDARLLVKATALAMERKTRARVTGEHARFCTGPAWSLLLSLFICRDARVAPAVTAVSYDVELPLSTCLRWLRQLEEAGMVESRLDADDGRVRRVAITSRAVALVSHHLDRA